MQSYPITFKAFLSKDKQNKNLLLLSALLIVIQFSIFKFLYPYASFIHGDSFSYLETAYWNLDINTYMVGYSRFLRLFSVFTSSDTALVLFQYLFIEAASLFFLFSLFYFYRVRKLVQKILLAFMVLNPLFLHLANLISSDCVFASLSLIWFTLLLWIIHNPSKKVFIAHNVILFFVFTVRYNALIYPFISALAFGISNISLSRKILNLAPGLVLCGLFILYTSYRYEQLTGFWQYSPFSGWQLTNNAMYAYRYVDSSKRKPVPKKFQALDNMIRTYFDSTHDTKKHPQEAMMASTVYMWDYRLTLYKYRDGLFAKDSTADELKKWASMGPFYKDYGLYIISQYPEYYARYFLWPSANKYYAPPIEFLKSYNSGRDSIAKIAKFWFDYKSRRVTTRMKNLTVKILDFYPILSGVINVVMLFGLICFSILNGWHKNTRFRQGMILSSIVWLLNAGFTIFASSAALRFQSFPILLTTTFSFLLVDWMWNMASIPDTEKSKLNTFQAHSLNKVLF